MPAWAMSQSPTVGTARNFLSVVWEGERPTDEVLLRALDLLLAAYHHTPEAAPTDTDLEPPRSGGPQLYWEVAARFPNYGHYPVFDPTASFGGRNEGRCYRRSRRPDVDMPRSSGGPSILERMMHTGSSACSTSIGDYTLGTSPFISTRASLADGRNGWKAAVSAINLLDV